MSLANTENVDPSSSGRERITTDRQLLERFVDERDQAAFADLVRRHRGVVWGVCRRVLGQEQDAEDAFQAVFLILGRKAASIRKRESLANWLHGVAYRTALQARRSAMRRLQREMHVAAPPPVSAASEQAAFQELQRFLDTEVEQLAEKYRAPFVLCCLEGLTRKEAARELGWHEGTVSSRLAQARDLLKARLLRRGVSLSAALTALALTQETSQAATSSALLNIAMQAGQASEPAGVTTSAVSLADSMMHAWTLARCKIGLAIYLLLTGLGVAAFVAAGGIGGAEALQDAPVQVEPKQAGAPADRGEILVNEEIWSLAFSPDGKRLATAGAGARNQPGQIVVWEVATAKPLIAIKGVLGVRSVAFSADGEVLATGDMSGVIRLQNSRTGADLASVKANNNGVNSVAFSHDGASIISAGLDGTAKIWSVDGLKMKQVLNGHAKSVFSAAFFRNGQSCATASMDQSAIIWDVATGNAKHRLQGHKGPVEAVAISPDDAMVATASWDETIKLWDADTGMEIGTLPQKEGWVLDVAFSPNGKWLASAAARTPHSKQKTTIRLWNVQTRQKVGSLQTHPAAARAIAFSRDGKFLASGSLDKTAKLWDMEAGKLATTFTAHAFESAVALAVGADGRLTPGEPKGGEEAQLAAAQARADAAPAAPNARGREVSWLIAAILLIAPLLAGSVLALGLYLWRSRRAKQVQVATARLRGPAKK